MNKKVAEIRYAYLVDVSLLKLSHDAADKKIKIGLAPVLAPVFFSGRHVIITKRRPYLYNTYFLSNRGKTVRSPTMAYIPLIILGVAGA